MKKITLIALLLIFSIASFAQENDSIDNSLGKNELKINMVSLIGFKWVDVSYEYLLNDESSFGVGTLVALDNSNEDLRTFSLTPYYRQFFSRKYAEGFFIEAFTMVHSAVGQTYNAIPPGGTYVSKKYTDLAVGISTGYKVISRKGFAAEVYLGIGRDMLGNSDTEVTGRGGISVGYRF